MLSIKGVHTFYGHIEALHGVDMEINEGEIVTLIGANGAGKSTLLMTICGDPRARRGEISFLGREITALPTYEIMRSGIAHAPEGRRIFPRMTILENLQMGAITGNAERFDENLERVFGLFPILKERIGQRGGTLSGGEQQMLAIARCLVLKPRLLILDEPTEGIMPILVQDIRREIAAVNKAGVSILLVEQNVDLALEIADRGYVLATGAIVLSGPASDLRNSGDVERAYMGSH